MLAAPAWRPAKFCHNPGEDWVLHSGIGARLSWMRWGDRVLPEERSRQARTWDEKAALHYCSQQSRETDVSLGHSPHLGVDSSSLSLLIGTGLHSFTNSRPVALLLLIKVQIPTSKRAQTGQHPYAVHVSHSIPLFTLTTWSAEQKWSWLRAPFAGGFCSCRQFSESDCAGEGRWGQLC